MKDNRISHGAREGHKEHLNENEISERVIGCAIKVHSSLGPGLLESVYERVLAYELGKCGMQVETQKPISFSYENIVFDEGFRADILVENCVIVEIKSVKIAFLCDLSALCEKFFFPAHPVHFAFLWLLLLTTLKSI